MSCYAYDKGQHIYRIAKFFLNLYSYDYEGQENLQVPDPTLINVLSVLRYGERVQRLIALSL